MEPKIKAKWIKALRSGKYKRAKEALKTDKGYCCLGVLREVMDPADRRSLDNGGFYLNYRQLRQCGLRADQQEELANLNDDGGYSFNMMAKHIEKTL